jgi:hypothetical protein
MQRIMAVAFAVGLLAFIGGAFAERHGYLDTLIGPASGPAPLRTVHYHAVLAAGDASIGNFDHATAAISARLRRLGVETTILTSDRKKATDGRDLATAYRIDVLFNQMETEMKPGDACLVFATSHGNEYGLVMKADDAEYAYLTPVRLAGILTRHCDDRPTVVILSGCHTGTFLIPQMQRDNRIILTAARHDRTSFGCSSDYLFTYFDECLLAALEDTGTWSAIFARTKACVARKESAMQITPSLPQAFFGEAVKDLAIE